MHPCQGVSSKAAQPTITFEEEILSMSSQPAPSGMPKNMAVRLVLARSLLDWLIWGQSQKMTQQSDPLTARNFPPKETRLEGCMYLILCVRPSDVSFGLNHYYNLRHLCGANHDDDDDLKGLSGARADS
jgi:hypothetical protein